MTDRYEAAVVGLGAMGSAALYHLARRGVRAVGIDRFRPPHTRGSSHGKTRVIREAYFEHPLYVPLVRRAYELWYELERESGRDLLLETGMLLVGPPGGEVVGGARASAELHGLPHERLSAGEVRRRFPMFRIVDGEEGLFEPRGGVLYPERCIEAHLEGARKRGADVRFDEPVRAWTADGDGVRLETPAGEVLADRVVCAAGAWTAKLVPDLDLPLTVTRETLHWFSPVPWAEHDPARWPVYGWEYTPGAFLYGFPGRRGTVKVAQHHIGRPVDPDRPRRGVDPREVSRVRGLLRRFLPDANGAWNRSCACLYTNTPDHHFLIDRHPEHPQVVVASPCSGHGFKFSSAVGELLAALAVGDDPGFDLAPFHLDRFREDALPRPEPGAD